jgi:T5SS/PEP-CTERM-associated repeat protein
MKPIQPSSNCQFPLALIFMSLGAATAATIDSANSGNWNAAATWSGGAVPQTGAGDTAGILSGHTVIYTNGAPYAGLDGSNDFGVGNGNSVNLNGGILSQAEGGWWVRIGHKGIGTLNINEGRFHVTDSTGGGTNLQVGVEANGNGTINVGDNSGAAGSAVLNLRDRVDFSANGGAFSLNLSASTGTVGVVTINSDGVLEGDQKTWNGTTVDQNPHIRIGQSTSDLQSVLKVNAGGQVYARGNVEIGAGNGAKGLLHLDGVSARMDMSDGEFTVGFTGSGSMTVENSAVFSRTDTPQARSDFYVGRNGTGTGTITIASGGAFRRESGGNIGDMRIGYDGTGVLNVEEDGLYHNESGNWDWLGQNSTGNGTVNVNGGVYEITSGSNLVVGGNGTGTFHHNSGSTNVSGVRAGVNDGTGLITIGGGTFISRGGFYLGGDSTTSTGTGSATVNQTGGELQVGGSLVVGIAAGHTGTYNLNGGTVVHTGSDISVAESGSGTLTIAAGATLTDTSTTAGLFYVGRNEGSSGTLIVNGTLTKSGGTNAIRVGNGNADDVDNTNATGLLGGTGTISSDGGVRIGSRGTLTAGLSTSVGVLGLTGNLSFSSGGKLHVDISGATADRVNINGNLDAANGMFSFNVLSTPTAASYVLAKYTGEMTGTLSGVNIPAGYELQHDTSAKEILLTKLTQSGYSAYMEQFTGLSASDKLPGADPDGDGLSNLVEYALAGLNPTTPDASAGTFANGVISFTKRDAAVANGDVTYVIQESTTLGLEPDPWTPVTTYILNDATTISSLVPSGSVKHFARLSIIGN